MNCFSRRVHGHHYTMRTNASILTTFLSFEHNIRTTLLAEIVDPSNFAANIYKLKVENPIFTIFLFSTSK